MKKIIQRIVETVRYNLGVVPETEDYVDDHIESGNIAIVRKLIAANPELIEWRNMWENTLLHIAVQEKQVELVDFLITAGCDVNAVDDSGETPLHVAAVFPSKKIAELLVRSGANPDIIDNAGATPLSIASE